MAKKMKAKANEDKFTKDKDALKGKRENKTKIVKTKNHIN